MDTFQTDSRSVGIRGPANSPWPKFCGDMKNTGLSKYDTSKNIGKLLWKYETDDIIHTDPVIGPDGSIYIGSDDYYFYAFKVLVKKQYTIVLVSYLYLMFFIMFSILLLFLHQKEYIH